MLRFAFLPSIFTAVLTLGACDAPPSVQKAIDEAERKEQEAGPRLDNPVLNAAQSEGKELYLAYLTGRWAPDGFCANKAVDWIFTEDAMARPDKLSNSNKPCSLAVAEALRDGSIAVAAYCPRLDQEDEAVVYAITRQRGGTIIIPGAGGGNLTRCE